MPELELRTMSGLKQKDTMNHKIFCRNSFPLSFRSLFQLLFVTLWNSSIRFKKLVNAINKSYEVIVLYAKGSISDATGSHGAVTFILPLFTASGASGSRLEPQWL